jgi:hypothetical protein
MAGCTQKPLPKKKKTFSPLIIDRRSEWLPDMRSGAQATNRKADGDRLPNRGFHRTPMVE